VDKEERMRILFLIIKKLFSVTSVVKNFSVEYEIRRKS